MPDRPLWERQIRGIDVSRIPPTDSLLTRVVPKPASSRYIPKPKTEESDEKAVTINFPKELTRVEYQKLRDVLKPYEDYLNGEAQRFADKAPRTNIRKSFIGTTFSFYIRNDEGVAEAATFRTNRVAYLWRCKKYTVGSRFIELNNDGQITSIGVGTNPGKNNVLIRSDDLNNAGVYIELTLGRAQHIRANCTDLSPLAESMINRTLDYTPPNLELETSESLNPFEVFVQNGESYQGFRQV